MRHVRLEAKSLWPIHTLKQVHHFFPAMHSAPANLSLGSQPLTIAFGHFARFGECLDSSSLIGFRILRPILDSRGRIDPDDAVGTRAQLTETAGHPARLANLLDEFLAV